MAVDRSNVTDAICCPSDEVFVIRNELLLKVLAPWPPLGVICTSAEAVEGPPPVSAGSTAMVKVSLSESVPSETVTVVS